MISDLFNIFIIVLNFKFKEKNNLFSNILGIYNFCLLDENET
jgi:hypothetical protein